MLVISEVILEEFYHFPRQQEIRWVISAIIQEQYAIKHSRVVEPTLNLSPTFSNQIIV